MQMAGVRAAAAWVLGTSTLVLCSASCAAPPLEEESIAEASTRPGPVVEHNAPDICAPRVAVTTLTFAPLNQINHDTCGPAAVANLWNALGHTPSMTVEDAIDYNCMGASLWGVPDLFGDRWPGTWPRSLRNCMVDFWTNIPADKAWAISCEEDDTAGDAGWSRLRHLIDGQKAFIALVWNGAPVDSISEVLHWVTVIGYTSSRHVRYVSYGKVLEIPFDDSVSCGAFKGFSNMWQNNPGVSAKTILGTGRTCHRLAIATQ